MKALMNLFKGMNPLVLFLVVFMLALGGCAAVRGAGDLFFGFSEAPPVDDPATPDFDESTLPPVPTPAPPGSAPSDWLGSILGVLFPGATTIAAGLRWLWIEARKRNLEHMFKAVVIGIKDAVDAAKGGKLNKASLYESIQGAADLFANRALFDKFVDDIKLARDAENKAAADEDNGGEVA